MPPRQQSSSRYGSGEVPFGLTLTLVLLIAFGQTACSDAEAARVPGRDRLHPALATYMVGVADDAFIPIVIHVGQAFTLQQTDRWDVLADADGTTPRERRLDGRRRLIAALRTNASTTQADLLSILDPGLASGNVRKLRRLWMLNAIACEIQKAALNQLVLNPTVSGQVDAAGIRLDLPRRVAGSSSSGHALAPSWSIQKIGADTLSSNGVVGDGVVVAVIDLGFNQAHQNLDTMDRVWTNPDEAADGTDTDLNGYDDDLTGWNFAGPGAGNGDVFGTTNPHGINVAGVVAGTGQGGTQTGVAPGARLMLLRVGSAPDATTQAEVWEAMQYAAAEGADIVNVSLKWRTFENPDLPSWRTEVDTLTELGVLFVTIAGNDADYYGSHPYTITTPGRVPSALTVGATDQNDCRWYDDSSTTLPPIGSNTGPVSWESVPAFLDYPYPPGLMKPDVVAPGVGITTTYLPGQYRHDAQGTSMAAPHASGLAALLLQLDANLGPYELRYLIQESALDLPLSSDIAVPCSGPGLGEPGPDVVFGWGRIDAGAAASLTPNLTKNSTVYDLAITATGNEWTTDDIWVDPDPPVAQSVNHLFANVRNLGGQVVGNVQLVFYYADVSTIGIGGFDPNGDGDPEDGNFNYIGTYAIPLLGPAGSDHAEATGLVKWEIPLPTSDHWCVGVAAIAKPPNAVEADVSNNLAFRNFVELLVMTSSNLEFRIEPPARERDQPFDFEVQRFNVPPEVRLYLAVDDALVPTFEAATSERGIGPLRSREEGAPGRALFPLEGDAFRFEGLAAPGGEALPVSLSVRVPPEIELPPDALVVMNVLHRNGKAAGGLSVKLVRGTSRQRGGPYHPRSRR